MPPLERSGAAHKLKRLSAMPPREITFRLREKITSEMERIGVGGARFHPSDFREFKSRLAGALTSRFYCRRPKEAAKFIRQHRPEWAGRAVEEAEQLCRHIVELLGYGPLELGTEINWHRDPLTGRVWERRFWRDYNLPQDCSAGDPKTIHELNRHQYLPRLAKAYLLTGEERYAAEALQQIESWIEQNPPGMGIHWHSSLEIGIRAISWMWTLFLLIDSLSLEEAPALRIGASLFAQLEHVYRHTSVFSSPNTHLIGEAAALFIAGLVFQNSFRPAAAWLDRGAELLAMEAGKQVLSDGVYGELSSYYHCYALDFYLQALILADQNAFRFPENVRRTAGSMLDFLLHVTRPDGSLPLIGDDDGGRALALVQKNYRSFRDALCLGSVLFLREDFKHQAGEFAEEALWLLGPEAHEIYSLLRAKTPAANQAFYPRAGYWIARSGWDPPASHLIFDCGGLGMGAGGHAHADALSLSLFASGRELLVDPGTFIYNGAPEWRSYFRSTRAHNTVVIDDQDQAAAADTFRWKTKLPCRVLEHLARPEIQYLDAEHAGYSRDRQGVIHRRRLLQAAPGHWIVVDDFRGCGAHTFDLCYHFGPGAQLSLVRQNGGRELAISAAYGDAALHLCICASGPLYADFICGSSDPIAGWISHQYGQKLPSTAFRARLESAVPAAAVTFLIMPSCQAFSASPPLATRLAVKGEGAIACSCDYQGFEDVVVFSDGETEIQVEAFRMRGEFFWLRMRDGILKRVLAIRAQSLSQSGRTVFEKQNPGTYFAAKDAGLEKSDVRDLRNRQFRRG